MHPLQALCRLPLVVMDDAAQHLPLLDGILSCSRCVPDGRLLADTLVRSGMIVLVDIVPHHPLEMAFVEDHKMIEALFTDRPHPALCNGICVWCSIGCANDGDAR